ncbi:MAG: YkgJ family cysteine cluster protein [Planctomycetota bacterium]|nr:YkgJ family cysteine cluster protein [Planctomycetota bacterium]
MGNKEKKKEKSKKKSGAADKSANSGKSSKFGESNEKLPWYADGLRFECSQCGDCCTGEPGYVWVDQDEIAAMAVQMQIDPENFERKFVRRVGRDKSLIEYPDGDCILLDPRTRKCTVYAARPIQCRTWPFWDSNLKKKKDWKETCEVCPGSGTGRLYTFEEIEAARKQKSV